MANLRDIFDRPFAGPEMRQKYEAALGEFLVAFNATENYMRFTAEEICKSVDQGELWKKQLASDDFSRQLKNLRLLILVEPFFSDTPFDRLEKLNATRNKLAHGHYDQDLFSDDFEIVGKKARTRISIEEIKKATAEAEDLWNELGWNLAHFWERQHGSNSDDG
ncbi:hypothetical protein HJC02_29310 [Rhizobium sp. NLR4a]|uniref:hypothetical protein n=1 Tax=Rhizobium sp. NLR4a TaxID=2731117 RepID=UPI001C830A86|nr:hypothetical protein [Rhizobium sp. NLR4a]MBX5236326.1 hypothetical protein [Rhizobium sp. NLR4a]